MTANLYGDDVVVAALGLRLPFIRNCCTSCHEDANQFGYDLCEVEFKDGTIGWVCCDYYNALKEIGVIDEHGTQVLDATRREKEGK